MNEARFQPAAQAAPQPIEIRIRRASAALEVDFDDGRRAALPAEYLRVESPSAEVQGHGPNAKKIVPGKAQVNIASVDPIGHYAIRVHFTDGHETGIFTWAYLHELAREYGPRWQAYLEALAAQGLQREPGRAQR
jgi:DUF971 family protein